MLYQRASRQAFFAVSAALFAASAAVTIAWCAPMSAMGAMPLLCGASTSTWMRMPGQSWLGAAASFLGMWLVMMAAMMLPSLTPMLWRYREAVGATSEKQLGRLTVLVGAGYFVVWTVFGIAVFPLGIALAAAEVQMPALARGIPIAAGVVVLGAGALQFTAWKARHLACCRQMPRRDRSLPPDTATALRHGLRLGLHCSSSSAGLTAIRSATSTSYLSNGCAFACHTQNPHSDNIYVRNSAGQDIWLDSSGNWYPVTKVQNGNVYTTNNVLVGPTSAGHYADAYWLTRNYGTLYGSSTQIPLRIDAEQAAAQDLIPFAITSASNNHVTYQMQMFTYNWTHSGASSPVTAVTSSMTDVNNLANYTVPNFYASQDYWYQNGCPTSSTCSVNDMGSETKNMLSAMNGLMPNPGDGTTSTSPQEVLFIVTDGVSDELISGSRTNREWNSTDLAQCTTIKNRGIRIAILYTQYLPESLTGDNWSQSNVAPYLPNVAPALQQCASTTPTGSPLFYQVTTDQSITDALTALFALTVQTAHLTR
jgi:predicted metal-binding membrane protein